MQKKLMSMLVMAAIFSLGTSVMAQDGGNAGDGKRKAARTAAKDKGDAQKDKALAAGMLQKINVEMWLTNVRTTRQNAFSTVLTRDISLRRKLRACRISNRR